MSIKVEFGFSPSGELVEYNDISADVISLSVDRGKDPQQETFNAASCSIQLNNQTRNFDPDYGPSPYQGLIAPTGAVRIFSDDQIVFTGIITDWNFSYSPSGESIAEIVASDAFWNLNNQVLTDYEPVEQLSSARILSVLARPEAGGIAVWPTASRKISAGVATMGDYSVNDGTNILSYLQEVEKAEPGRLFIDKEGRIVFRSRNNDLDNPSFEYTRVNLSANPSFETNTRSWETGGGTLTRTSTPLLPTKTNLVPFATVSANNAEFLGTAGTGGSETTSFVTNSEYPSGVALRRTITTSGSTESFIGMGTTVARNAAVTAGQTYTGSVYVLSQFAFSGRVTLVWRDIANAVISTVGPANQSISPNQLIRLDFTGVAPAGAVAVGVRLFYTTTSATSGESIDYSSHQVELSSSLGEYFDGNTKITSVPGYAYKWNGTIQASTSSALDYFGASSGSLSPGGFVNQYFESTPFADYTASIYIRGSDKADGSVLVRLSGLTSGDGTTYSEVNSVTASVTNTAWTRVSTTFSSISGFSGIRVRQTPSDEIVFLDALLIEETPIVDAYFDGSNSPVYNTTDPSAPDYQPERAFETYDTDWIIE